MKRASVMMVMVVLGLASSVAWAHPGHGEVGQGWTLLHWVAEPLHATGLALVMVAALVAWRLWGWARASQAQK
jgi:hydrogenase/urease accessory protein HupE